MRWSEGPGLCQAMLPGTALLFMKLASMPVKEHIQEVNQRCGFYNLRPLDLHVNCWLLCTSYAT